jgi:hypothetical protein
MNKTIVGILILASTSVCQASYELVLVGDNDYPGVATSAIHRYDAVSGAYLGSFGASYDDIKDFAIAPKLGRVFSMSSNGLREIDYSTGIEHRAITGATGSSLNISDDGTTLYVQSASQVKMYSTSTLLQTGSISLGAGANIVQSIQIVGSNIYSLERNASNVYQYAHYNMSGVRQGGIGSQLNISGKLGYQVSTPQLGTLLLCAGVSTGGVSYSFTSPGANPTAPSTYSPTGITGVVDVAPLHIGGALLGVNPSNTAQGLVAITGATGGVQRVFGTSQIVAPAAIATVVAPEPGSMLVVLVGICGLAHRRRGRN